MSSLQELQDKAWDKQSNKVLVYFVSMPPVASDEVADLQKQNEILGGYLNDPNEQKDEIEFQASGMENEMLADYLQRDAERTSGLEDNDEDTVWCEAKTSFVWSI